MRLRRRSAGTRSRHDTIEREALRWAALTSAMDYGCPPRATMDAANSHRWPHLSAAPQSDLEAVFAHNGHPQPPLVAWLSQLPGGAEECKANLFRAEERYAVMEGEITGLLPNPPDEPPGLICGGGARGKLVFIPQGAANFLADRGSCDRVLEAIRWLATETGTAEVVLGSLTTSVTDSGRKVAAYVDTHGWPLKVITGNAGTVGVLWDFLLQLLGGDRDAVVGIVGLGNIGTTLLRLLVAHGQRRVVVYGRAQASLDRALAGVELGDTVVEASVDAAGRTREAHMLVCLTSSPTAVIRPEYLAEPTVIIDPSIPYAVAPDPGWALGGHVVYTHAGQLSVGTDMGIESWRAGAREKVWYACLAEGAARALAVGRGETRDFHQVGPVDLEHVAWFEAQRALLGWDHAPAFMFDAPVTLDAGREVLAARRTTGRVLVH